MIIRILFIGSIVVRYVYSRSHTSTFQKLSSFWEAALARWRFYFWESNFLFWWCCPSKVALRYMRSLRILSSMSLSYLYYFSTCYNSRLSLSLSACSCSSFFNRFCSFSRRSFLRASICISLRLRSFSYKRPSCRLASRLMISSSRPSFDLSTSFSF